MSEWKEFFLNDVYTISSGLSKPAEDFGSGFPFLSFKEVFNNFFVPKNLSELVESSEKERLTCSIKRGDVFLTRTSETVNELGMSCVALEDHKNATFNGFTKRLRPKGNIEIVPEYAGYYFRNTKFRKEITSMSSASTRASLNIEMIGRLKIVLPSKAEQSSIGFILKTLDDKIDNLRRQNETLEAIAQTLFKHWFIDFEFPNADGKPYKSSGGAMIPSELGEIPEGWEITYLKELVTVTDYVANGSFASLKENVKTYDSENYALYVRLVDYNNQFSSNLKYVDKSSFEFLSKSQLKDSYIIVSNIGANAGTIFRPPAWLKKPMVLGSNSIVFYSEYFSEYVYYFLSGYEGKNVLQGIIGGSAQPKFNKTDFRAIELIKPDFRTIKNFNKLVVPFRDKFFLNNASIQTLTKTRDALLPKLMSGQLRVKE